MFPGRLFYSVMARDGLTNKRDIDYRQFFVMLNLIILLIVERGTKAVSAIPTGTKKRRVKLN